MLSVEIIAKFKHKSFTLVRATNKNRSEIVTLTRRQPTFEPQIKALKLTILNRNLPASNPPYITVKSCTWQELYNHHKTTYNYYTYSLSFSPSTIDVIRPNLTKRAYT